MAARWMLGAESKDREDAGSVDAVPGSSPMLFFVRTPCSGMVTHTRSGSFDYALKNLVKEISSRRFAQDDRYKVSRFSNGLHV